MPSHLFPQGNIKIFFVFFEINRFSTPILLFALTFVFQGKMKTFFCKEVGQWFANPGLGRKRARTCQKLVKLVFRVKRKFKNHCPNTFL